jgi:hypothetical protein
LLGFAVLASEPTYRFASTFTMETAMRVVHMCVPRADFADKLGEMREWLDRQNRPLVRFETASDGNTITIKVQFDDDDLAELFRQEFRGSYID